MIPYANFLYFATLLPVVIPTLLVRVLGKLWQYWLVAITLVMLVVQYAGTTVDVNPGLAIHEIWFVAGFALLQTVVALAFLCLRRSWSNRWLFYLVLALSLAPLVATKLVAALAPTSIVGFLGISYVTFRNLDVLIGIQDGLITSLPVPQFLAFVFFFPTISAGPIDRYRRFAGDWNQKRTRAEFLKDLDGAVHRIFTGFLYSFIVAVLIKRYWLDPAASGASVLSTLSYMYAYAFWLFFDFAGYSAFAVGVSYIFGIHSPENFNRPFLAHNIVEFWNRWHISLSLWFRDHVYMRFVLAARKGRWVSNKYLASYLGLFLSFGLMGLWHGTQVHYLIYGVYHGSLLVGHDLFGRWNRKHRLWGDGPLWRALGTVITFNVICFGLLLFSGHSIVLTLPTTLIDGTTYKELVASLTTGRSP